jgi:D-aminoacyl-tRNA deacylase
MRFAIIICKPDTASLNIHNHLDKLPENTAVHVIDKESIHCEDLDKKIDADIFIFATKHKAASGIASLSVHTQGNWSKAKHGGKDRMLAVSPAIYLKEALCKLEELKIDGFDVIQECTHHGPNMNKPSMFIEIGSSEKEWDQPKPAKVIAEVIQHIVSFKPTVCRTAVGIGGPHHTPSFKKIQLDSDVAIGHVCPKYMLEVLDKELIQQALEKTVPKADLIILDWKGLGEFKQQVSNMCEELGVETKKTRQY